jgi:putative membrane protein
MKNVLNFYLCLASIFFFFCCNNNPSSDSVKKAKASNAAKIDSQKIIGHTTDLPAVIPSKADADFLVNAASGSMMEVQLGQLAQTNSVNQRIKAFGAMMEKDHGVGGAKLTTLAASKNVTLPDAISNNQQKEKERLEKKKGNQFDRTYIIMMVSDHKKDIRKFERAAKNATDNDIKAFAADNLPMLNKHLDSAVNLLKLLGINDDRKDILPIQ